MGQVLCVTMKTGLKQLIISCLYKLLTGKIEKVCNFLKGLYTNLRREIWLLGDFNVDYMDRANESRTKFIDVFRTLGLRQIINIYTRPNDTNGGTCIDWILANCDYVSHAGVYDVFRSDHLPVYCIRKKPRECHRYVYRISRDLSNYDHVAFAEFTQGC